MQNLMICFTQKITHVRFISQYSFFQKSSRRFLSATKYINHRFLLKKNKRTALMFVRAPKHFKAGKQRVVFFNSLFKPQSNFYTSRAFFFLTTNYSQILYDVGKWPMIHIRRPDLSLSRVTIKAQICFKLI